MTAILGQSRPLEILTSALRSGRFHHGWIFSGPRGVGKFTVALQVARVLLDPEANLDSLDLAAPIQNPKSNGGVQNLIDSNTHPDLHIITKELAKFSDNPQLRERKLMNIPLDLLRERMLGGKTADDRVHESPAYRTAALGHGKVFIIDEAELLDPNAQNAMLKTLEEPPPQTYFFLITSLPDRLLSTIRSRCQHVRFNRLDPQAMRRWLKTQNVGGLFADQTVPAMAWIEQFADGSPGIARLAAEFGFFEWQQTLEPMLADLDRGTYPTGMGAALGERIEAFAVAWVKKHGEKNTSKDAANKDAVRHMLAVLAANLRQRLVADLDRSADTSPRLAAIDLLHDAERQLESNVNMKLLMENLVVQWAESHAGAGTSG